MTDTLSVPETHARFNATNWDELLPDMFKGDSRFRRSKASRRRYQAEINGTRTGVVVAWRPAEYANFALNKEDIDRLIQLRQDGSFHTAFVVLASVGEHYGSSYVAHCDADELYETLKKVHFRTGPHGDYWLLRADFSSVDADLGVPF